MNTVEISLKILKELEDSLKSINPKEVEKLVDTISSSKKIFVAGAGRSRLMMLGLAMRLMQLGFRAYVVGETVTPAIGSRDLLIIGSGSGETGTMKAIAKNAKKAGAKLALITIYPDSSIGRLANLVIQISAATSKVKNGEGIKSFQPGANTFEQSLLLICDTVAIRLIEKLNILDANEILMKYHANLE
ncbi:MAG: 6-phospho-3-hexuloisomerase [Chloroflexota bacterium]|nr:6-phospho-3-hexuloisomerase [Chloroflexota bacterium]